MQPTPTVAKERRRSAGQIIPIFAGAMLLFVLLSAAVIDLSWYWTNNLRIQRAADAAALAGVIFLPGNETKAISVAREEAAKNGYTHGVNGFTVTAAKDPTNFNRLKVNISGRVGTFFAKTIGIATWPASRDAKADYVLPVPMGSPENYYGVFGMTRGLTSTETVPTPEPATERLTTSDCTNTSSWPNTSCSGNTTPSSGNFSAPVAPSAAWTASTGAVTQVIRSNNDQWARSPSNGNGTNQTWWGFGLQPEIYDPPTGESISNIDIYVRIRDAFINSTCNSSNLSLQLSWNGGTSWTSDEDTGQLPTNTSNGDFTLGGDGWGRTWSRSEFTDTNFRVRVNAEEGCSGNRQFSIDELEVRLIYTRNYTVIVDRLVTTDLADKLLEGPGTPCTSGKELCYEADGADLNPRGFWGTLNTQGAENVNGDAYQPYYDTRTGTTSPSCASVTTPNRACYDAVQYYNYGIEMAPGSTGGSVYVYDPGFCGTQPDSGTGDRWFGGSAAVSTFYEVYDTGDNLRELADDTLLFDSGSRFRGMDAEDSTMDNDSDADCDECLYYADDTYGDGRDYHNRWYLLASGLTGGPNGTIYRLHTTSTDPADNTAQRGTNGENSFAIFASASGAAPRVYGLGAMQAFTPLSASGSQVQSEFYLAQIESVHAGKTVEIKLWDPGDTRPLTADLQILVPNSGGWSPTTFTYSAVVGTTNSGAAGCTGTGSGTSVRTNVGDTGGTYNGCWLVIRAVIPPDYEAPQDGWWKIRYIMNGNGTSNDVTTWQVNVIGNPVHLVLP